MNNPMQNINISLAKAAPFSCDLDRFLSTVEQARLAELHLSRHLGKGEHVFHQRSEAKHVFIVEEGVLMIERLSATGRRQVMAFIFPGDFLGFTPSSFFEYSVVALCPSVLRSYPRKAFMKLSDEIPTLKNNLGQISNNVLARTMDQVFAMGQKKAHERLCFLIKQLADRNPGANRERIEFPMTRQDIADNLGLTIETVSRAFRRLKKEGVLGEVTPQNCKVLEEAQLIERARLD